MYYVHFAGIGTDFLKISVQANSEKTAVDGAIKKLADYGIDHDKFTVKMVEIYNCSTKKPK